jgi:hypothetical protein
LIADGITLKHFAAGNLELDRSSEDKAAAARAGPRPGEQRRRKA